MKWLRVAKSRLLALLHRETIEQDIDEELRGHIEILIERNIQSGMTPEEARIQAMKSFGNLGRVKDQARDVRGGGMIDELLQDIRFGLRVLVKDPGFTIAALFALALGIGANSAIFSVFNTVILKPLPYPDPDRLVLIWERNREIGKDEDSVAPLNYIDWRQQNQAFEDLAAFQYSGFTLSGGEYPEQVGSLVTTANLFKVLGVQAKIGRTFTEEEAKQEDRVVVLGHQFWQTRFGRDHSIIGKSLVLDGFSYTVLGVMPPHFKFPDGQPAIETYTPLSFSPEELQGRRAHRLTVIGRLRKSASMESASANLSAIARAISAADPGSNPEVKLLGAHDQLVQDVRLPLYVLFGSVGFVLLIACANVANLLMVRASGRTHEIAVRACLGAGRTRILRQLLVESLLLSLSGGLCGILFARVAVDLFVHFGPADLPRIDQIVLDSNVFLFACALSLLTGIVFAIFPALHLTGNRLYETIKQSSIGLTDQSRVNFGRSLLVVTQMAISLILIIGAGLMVQTIWNLQKFDYGFRSENVLTMQLFLPDAKYPIDRDQFRPRKEGITPDRLTKPAAFYSELLQRIGNIPGVEAAGATTALPLNQLGIDFDLPVVIDGKPAPKTGEEPQADFRVISPGYLPAMGIRLIQGRNFTEQDDGAATDVILINETLAKQMFAGENPIGKRILLYGRLREIVGIIGSIRHYGFKQAARPEMMVPYKQLQFGGMTLAVRSRVDPALLAKSIRKEVHSLDPEQPVYRERTMQQLVWESVAEPRFIAILLAGFATLALTLALIGVYSVMSYTVAKRSQEIGIRMALGADRTTVMGMVVRHGLLLTFIGILIGSAGGAALTSLMRSLLFGVSSGDLLTFVGTSILLILCAFSATYLPARRASKIDPMAALRYQ